MPPAWVSAGPVVFGGADITLASGVTGRRAPSIGSRQTAFVGKIREARHVVLELQRHRAGRSMALLADDDFGLAVRDFHFRLPLEMLFRPGPRFAVLEIILLAINEHHHVGVLLDRAGFTQVRELGALVIAAFDLTGELR